MNSMLSEENTEIENANIWLPSHCLITFYKAELITPQGNLILCWTDLTVTNALLMFAYNLPSWNLISWNVLFYLLNLCTTVHLNYGWSYLSFSKFGHTHKPWFATIQEQILSISYSYEDKYDRISQRITPTCNKLNIHYCYVRTSPIKCLLPVTNRKWSNPTCNILIIFLTWCWLGLNSNTHLSNLAQKARF